MDPVLLLTIGLAVGSLVAITFLMLQGNNSPVAERLSQLDSTVPQAPVGRMEPVVEKPIPRLARSQTVQSLKEEEPRDKLQSRMIQAGLYKKGAVRTFNTARMACAAAP